MKSRQAEQTAGRLKSALNVQRHDLVEKLSTLKGPEVVKATFSLTSADIGEQTILSISNGSVGYEQPILKNVYLSLSSTGRMAIVGDNGSGKTSLVKAILGDNSVTRSGQWHCPRREDIGYLDQHYQTLNLEQSAFEIVQALRTDWSIAEIRCHLNSFLFRKNEEINTKKSSISLVGKEHVCRLLKSPL